MIAIDPNALDGVLRVAAPEIRQGPEGLRSMAAWLDPPLVEEEANTVRFDDIDAALKTVESQGLFENPVSVPGVEGEFPELTEPASQLPRSGVVALVVAGAAVLAVVVPIAGVGLALLYSATSVVVPPTAEIPPEPVAQVLPADPPEEEPESAESAPLEYSLPVAREGVGPTAVDPTDLAAMVAGLSSCPGTVVITGHTCSLGTTETNGWYGQARARSAAELLVGAGLPSAKIQTVSAGASQPISSNEDPEGRRQNRRVTIACHPEQPAPRKKQ